MLPEELYCFRILASHLFETKQASESFTLMAFYLSAPRPILLYMGTRRVRNGEAHPLKYDDAFPNHVHSNIYIYPSMSHPFWDFGKTSHMN